ncbi:MAG: hypothetical protein R3B09_29175 [Nannocystaceae bacterium]
MALKTSSKIALASAAIALVHLVLVYYAFPPAVVLGDAGYPHPDYQTHYQQTVTILEVWETYGRFWAYDPGLLAGEPAGLFFDVDNKAHFLFVLALTRLGVAVPVAFNLFPVLSSLLAPLSLAAAARLLRFTAPAIVVAAGLGVLLWHFDSTVHFVWGGGMVSFATVSHLSVVVVALMHRMLGGARPWRDFAGLALLLPLCLLIHVWAFAALVVPLTGLYLLAARRLDLQGHLRVWLVAIAGVLVNLYWLWPALQHLAWMTASTTVGQATPIYVLADYLEILVNPVNTGFAQTRTLFRLIAIFGSVAAMIGWRRAGDPRLRPAALGLGWLAGLTYVGALLPIVATTEPYRFAVPLALWAAVFAAPWLVEACAPGRLRALPGALRGLAILLVVVAIPRVSQQVVTFVPELGALLQDDITLDHRGNLVPTEDRTMRTPPLPDEYRALAATIDALPGDGRVLVGLWPVGEFLRWASRRPVIGGFPDRRVAHEAANIFRLRPEETRHQGAAFGDYLERYHIEYVVFSPPYYPELEARRDLLEPVRVVGGHKIFHVRRPSTYFAEGQGRVSASLGRIEVHDAAPAPGTESLVLRFHAMEVLRCRPNCRLEVAPIPDDPVGFLRVVGEPTLPRDLVIEQVWE